MSLESLALTAENIHKQYRLFCVDVRHVFPNTTQCMRTHHNYIKSISPIVLLDRTERVRLAVQAFKDSKASLAETAALICNTFELNEICEMVSSDEFINLVDKRLLHPTCEKGGVDLFTKLQGIAEDDALKQMGASLAKNPRLMRVMPSLLSGLMGGEVDTACLETVNEIVLQPDFQQLVDHLQTKYDIKIPQASEEGLGLATGLATAKTDDTAPISLVIATPEADEADVADEAAGSGGSVKTDKRHAARRNLNKKKRRKPRY